MLMSDIEVDITFFYFMITHALTKLLQILTPLGHCDFKSYIPVLGSSINEQFVGYVVTGVKTRNYKSQQLWLSFINDVSVDRSE